MIQAVQIAGAIVILAGFALTQFRVRGTDSFPHLALNLTGGVLLLINERRWRSSGASLS